MYANKISEGSRGKKGDQTSEMTEEEEMKQLARVRSFEGATDFCAVVTDW